MPESATNDPRSAAAVEEPPRTIGRTLLRLGPGLIIAGSIVGSGELIATTKTGAEAGMSLLWLIVVGCVIKVFIQIQFGRHAVTHGETTLAAINRVPGPRWRANWIVWFWLAMMVASVAQLGGIVQGVGQALAITAPLTGDFQEALRLATDPYTYDDKIWAAVATVITVCLLYFGRYALLQNLTMAMVALFTVVVVATVIGLQIQTSNPQFRLGWSDWLNGFGWPESTEKGSAFATALATFGIIGVGAAELVAYPYWCLEKGYARFTGPRTDDDTWAARARGWIRVMRTDAWLSLFVYTIVTVAFFVLGAVVLHRQGLDPQGVRMVSTLKEQFTPIFGDLGGMIFLVGAVCVLYSTFLVANAGNARAMADSLIVVKLVSPADESRQTWVRRFSVFLPAASLVICLIGYDPVALVLLSGVMQALMLPMLGIAAVWLRYRASDARLTPSKLFDAFLLLSLAGALIAGAWAVWSNFRKMF